LKTNFIRFLLFKPVVDIDYCLSKFIHLKCTNQLFNSVVQVIIAILLCESVGYFSM